MIFNASEILEKVLREREFQSCSFRASRSILEKFKKRCKKDGTTNYSPILEAIIKKFMEHSETGKPIKINVAQAKDRASASFSCSIKLWEEFSRFLPELGLDRVRTMEFLMEEYCKQRANRK